MSGHSTEGPIHPPSPFLIIANKISKGPVILNVGGKRHEVMVSHEYEMLRKRKLSCLGKVGVMVQAMTKNHANPMNVQGEKFVFFRISPLESMIDDDGAPE